MDHSTEFQKDSHARLASEIEEMDEAREHENFDYFVEYSPERKIELVNGQLVVGNSLVGSRLLLDHILRGWGADAAVAFGLIGSWIEALCAAYHLNSLGSNVEEALPSLSEKTSNMDYVIPDLTEGAEGEDAGHRRVSQHIYFSFWGVAEALGGHVLGRGFVMRLRDQGFMPDAMFFRGTTNNTLYEYYLDGPAELVIEVTRPTHRIYDERIKREHYSRAGVPAYLVVDPQLKDVQLWRLERGDYVLQGPDQDGLYRIASVPGLTIDIQKFWTEDEHISLSDENNPFTVEAKQPSPGSMRGRKDGLGSEYLPVDPRLDRYPVKLRFEEYICWCPEAKFEFWDGRIRIGGTDGVGSTTALLVASLGMIEACRQASPAEWVAALMRRLDLEERDQEIRDAWRTKVIAAAAELREKYDLKRIAITGDLIDPKPLNYWSRPELVIWDIPDSNRQAVFELIYQSGLDLIDPNWPHVQAQIKKGSFSLEEI
jgi:Putative restriction endonuclease